MSDRAPPQRPSFGIKQRRVFQIIENESVPFAAIEAYAMMICLASLAMILDGNSRNKFPNRMTPILIQVESANFSLEINEN